MFFKVKYVNKGLNSDKRNINSVQNKEFLCREIKIDPIETKNTTNNNVSNSSLQHRQHSNVPNVRNSHTININIVSEDNAIEDDYNATDIYPDLQKN